MAPPASASELEETPTTHEKASTPPSPPITLPLHQSCKNLQGAEREESEEPVELNQVAKTQAEAPARTNGHEQQKPPEDDLTVTTRYNPLHAAEAALFAVALL
ncbi:hypothetical protein KEM48_005744 [Puccinia striiformis f. sp. tritici PST-130]|nr:hypothetical protein KEM48_005744 [Puccinia striiformis f. sp. tritici PST-130]